MKLNLIILWSFANCALTYSHEHTKFRKVFTTYTADQVFNSMVTNIKYSGNAPKLHFNSDELTAKESTRASRIYESAIYFPSSSSYQDIGRVGDKCATFYGTTGSCQPMNKCYQEAPPFQTQLLVNCGTHNQQPMICCPANAIVKTEPVPTPKTQTSHHVPEPVQSKPTSIVNKPSVVSSPTEDKSPAEPVPAVTSTSPRYPTNFPAREEYANPITPISSVPKVIPPKKTPSNTAESVPVINVAPETAPPPKVILPNKTPSNTVVPQPSKNFAPEIVPSVSPNPVSNSIDESTEVCGVYNISTFDGLSGNSEVWPWVVSVGRRSQNGSIQWNCLGSLITKDYIVTSAICLQQNPNIAAFGMALLGPMSKMKARRLGLLTRAISQVTIHENFVKPYLYKNLGLIQLSSIVPISQKLLPICFPFLASVLDILHFSGSMAKTLGFEFPVDRSTGLQFHQEEYRILSNDQCDRVFVIKKSETFERFPRGIQLDNICGLKKTATFICQAPGAPLVLYDEASSSYVIIGIASGDPTCAKFNRQLVTFTRMNSYSTWVRERVAVFPTPPPCYF